MLFRSLNAVETTNEYQLDHLITTIKNAVGGFKSRKITILGLAFKPDTDDIRDSVSIKLIYSLLKNKAKVIVHDPKAIENTKEVFRNKITYADSLERALNGTDCAIIMTSWRVYSQLNHIHVNKMRKRIIVDTRRILKNHKLNIEYYPIGIGSSSNIYR